MKAQVVFCKCGQIIAACMEPDFYDDGDWRKTLKRAIKLGRKIDTIENDVVGSDAWGCKCPAEEF